MNDSNIRVSIGMPVFNGEEFIKDAIDSIIGQTFPYFELTISDNASTDRTQEICQEYVSRDKRIKYYRLQKNIGAPRNYNRVFELSAKSEYFKWSAYDDVLAPTFLSKCIKKLDEDNSIVGCHCKTGRIDKFGKFLGYYNKGLLSNIDSPKPQKRFRDLIGLYYTTTPFHGVYRRDKFAKSQLHGSYIGADRNLVAELALMGRIYELPECLFFWREHPSSYTSMYYGRERDDSINRLRAELSWWSKEKGTYYPHWINFAEYLKSIKRSQLTFSNRLLCYGKVLEWIRDEGYYFLSKDIFLLLIGKSRVIVPALLPLVSYTQKTHSELNKKIKRLGKK